MFTMVPQQVLAYKYQVLLHGQLRKLKHNEKKFCERKQTVTTWFMVSDFFNLSVRKLRSNQAARQLLRQNGSTNNIFQLYYSSQLSFDLIILIKILIELLFCGEAQSYKMGISVMLFWVSSYLCRILSYLETRKRQSSKLYQSWFLCSLMLVFKALFVYFFPNETFFFYRNHEVTIKRISPALISVFIQDSFFSFSYRSFV